MQRSVDERRADLELVITAFELDLEFGALVGDALEPLTDLRLGEVAVGSEIYQVGLLAIELGEALLDLVAQQLCGEGLVLERVIHGSPNARDEVRLELDRPVVRNDRVLDLVDLCVARLARVVLLAATEEVVVLASALADGPLDEQPRFAAGVVAPSTPDAALEVVRVLTEPFAGRRARFEYALHLLEQLLADERFVSALVELTVVDDHAAVVRVSKHRLELRCRHRTGGIATSPPDESAFSENGL